MVILLIPVHTHRHAAGHRNAGRQAGRPRLN